jgi:hypothetical protein
MLDIAAHINNISYKPLLCKELQRYSISQLEIALRKPSFLLDYLDNTNYAISQWVSPKRTRSYPYVRVYDTLAFNGKRITLIPVIKDEGFDGDRDYIQWDTISLMSLLQTYVIITYYDTAEKSLRYSNKITKQKVSSKYLIDKLAELHCYKSDALHWNLLQTKEIHSVTQKALESYQRISRNLGVKMHDGKSVLNRIENLTNDFDYFLNHSRLEAQKAQHREALTTQPKELTDITIKAKITVTNFLKGVYFFTVDEAIIRDNELYLIEAKHSANAHLPSREDIIDGLIKMTLFSNLEDVTIGEIKYKHIPTLKLTTSHGIEEKYLSERQRKLLTGLKQVAVLNKFSLILG